MTFKRHQHRALFKCTALWAQGHCSIKPSRRESLHVHVKVCEGLHSAKLRQQLARNNSTCGDGGTAVYEYGTRRTPPHPSPGLVARRLCLLVDCLSNQMPS
uniref:Secreted protein n=1 Tax=Mesocestoides corti TaxID=53468 RepID=A0A5K3FKB5_MESCO